MNTSYSIKDIESITGIKAHTLRIWEQRYNLVSPARTDTNIRFYSEDQLKQLLNIALLVRNGYRISEIAIMQSDQLQLAVRELTLANSDENSRLHALTIAMLELNESMFEKQLGKVILQFGLEKAMTQVIFPFFQQIGFMWQTGSINPAHEHFITHLVRQKLMVALDGQSLDLKPFSKSYLLYLPENEYHEIGLLFAAFVIRQRGHKVVYLGQNVPYEDLAEVYKLYKPDYFMTAMTSPLLTINPVEYIERLSSDYPNVEILVSGKQFLDSIQAPPKNVKVIKTFKEMILAVSED